MVFYQYIYSHILVTVVKEFTEEDQQIKKTLHNSRQEQKYLGHPFYLIVLKSQIILVQRFRKLNQQFNLKQKFCFIRPKENSIFKFHDINGIKLLNHLRLHFSHLKEHKFWHNFRAAIDPMCSCGLEPETTIHYLLCCNLYSDLRTELLNDVCALNQTLKNLPGEKLLNILLYGLEDFSFDTNEKIIKSTIKFLKTSEHSLPPFFDILYSKEY